MHGTRYGFAIASSTRGLYSFGPLTDLAISVLREIVFSLCLSKSALLTDVISKDGSGEELA